MIRVAVFGAGGRMGAHVLDAIEASPEASVSAAIDRPGNPRAGQTLRGGIALTTDLDPALESSDVVIDFSTPEASLQLIEAARAPKLPLVIATTGFSAAEHDQIRERAREIPILISPSFSPVVHVLGKLVAEAARLLPQYEIEVLELHHSAKVDAPSGTALRLAQMAAQARGRDLAELAVYHREGHTGPRPPDAIGMQTLRAGTSTGEHTIFVAGPGERLELTHRSQSRESYAHGALQSALWLVGKAPGLYSVADVFDAPA